MEIIINDRWSIKRDAYCWQLTESTRYVAKNDTKHAKKGEERVARKETWHSTILQACKKIVNTSASGRDAKQGRRSTSMMRASRGVMAFLSLGRWGNPLPWCQGKSPPTRRRHHKRA